MAFAIAVDGHPTILADLERNAILRRNGAARVRAPSEAVRCRPVSKMQPLAGQRVRTTRNERRFTLWLPLPILANNAVPNEDAVLGAPYVPTRPEHDGLRPRLSSFGIPKRVDLDRMTKQQLIENVPTRTRTETRFRLAVQFG